MNKLEEKELERLLTNTLSYRLQELENAINNFKVCLGKEIKTFGIKLKSLIKIIRGKS